MVEPNHPGISARLREQLAALRISVDALEIRDLSSPTK
jgi:hypothetical protein